MLSICNLHFGYIKQIEILHGISCEIEQGELVSVLGPNGYGKTTLVKCINRIHDPWQGTIRLRELQLQSALTVRSPSVLVMCRRFLQVLLVGQ